MPEIDDEGRACDQSESQRARAADHSRLILGERARSRDRIQRASQSFDISCSQAETIVIDKDPLPNHQRPATIILNSQEFYRSYFMENNSVETDKDIEIRDIRIESLKGGTGCLRGRNIQTHSRTI